jgi:hypothetical protein
MSQPPEYNVTGHDYTQRGHLTYAGPPLIDAHAHVTMTQASDASAGPAGGAGASGSSAQAALLLDVAAEFGVTQVVTMCPPQDIAPLRERFGDRLLFNGMLNKKLDEPDDAAYQLLDQFLAADIRVLKLWAAPRGRERGLFVDAPWRIEGVRRAAAAGVRVVMVHVGDPDAWFSRVYTDASKFGTKPEQYERFARLLQLFPQLTWIGAHLGGDPEHPDHLEALLESYPHLYFDTSATKWQVREVSPRAEAWRSLVERHPTRFLFGSDLVTRHGLVREHYVSRYWCQRTLWESTWAGPSPIADPDHEATPEQPTPWLRGVGLTPTTLRAVYADNAQRILAKVALQL